MTKTFKEVFPTLKLDKDMENLLENADVTRISVNHARDFYKIYVKAKRLIFKKNIWKLEESIKNQIFKSKDITVKIIESYELSSQYTPKTLFDVYFDSILDEINSHSVLLYNLLRTSKWSFTDDTHVTVTLEETIIAKTRGNSVIEFLEKVFCERCGMDFIVNLQYENQKSANTVKMLTSRLSRRCKILSPALNLPWQKMTVMKMLKWLSMTVQCL